MVKPVKPFETQRGYFSYYLYELMEEKPDVYLITCDLGYKMFDAIREDFPDRFINVGASEQTAVDMAVGLALSGKVPFVYSITPFIIWRPAESLRIYLDHESIPVKLVGSGRDDDYKEDGFTHDATDVFNFLSLFKNIISYWPKENWVVRQVIRDAYENNKPTFISLKR
jgi:transketolase